MFLRLHPQLTPGPFTETLTWSDEIDTSNKCNKTIKSVPKFTGDLKQARVAEAKKPKRM